MEEILDEGRRDCPLCGGLDAIKDSIQTVPMSLVLQPKGEVRNE